ncbi:MAG: TadE/TadG family type IV pilus assembly protein [Chloroflexota bacterium]
MRLRSNPRFHLRQRRRSRGQGLVEFALILPVFIVFFGAVLDLGRIAAAQVTVANAAREGAFQASKTPGSYTAGAACPADGSSNLVVCRVLLEAKNSVVAIQPADVTMTCSPNCTQVLGNTVRVTVAGRFQLLMPFMAAFFGGTQNVSFAASSVQQLDALPAAASAATASPTATATATATPTATPTPTPGCTVPSAGFTYSTSPPSMKAAVTVTVSDTSTSPGCAITEWLWSWGDGTTSTAQNPGNHTYVAAGTYLLTLKVTNPTDSNTTGSVTLKVKP